MCTLLVISVDRTISNLSVSDLFYLIFFSVLFVYKLQSTLVISNSKGLYETLRDIRSSTYQIYGTKGKQLIEQPPLTE